VSSPQLAGARVLAISQNQSVPADGRVWNEARALRAASAEVVVICPQGEGAEREPFELREGVLIYRYPHAGVGARPLGHLREYAAAYWRISGLARRLASEHAFNVVQAANPPDFLLLAVRWLKRRGACLIFDHHDLWPELYLARSGGRKGPFYWLIVGIERLNYRLADIVLATNESYEGIALGRGRKRPADVFVVRNGPELGTFVPVASEPRLKRGRPHLISYIGEMAPQDGVDHALRALARLRDQRDDWHAVLAGDGEAAQGLRRLARELGLDGRVEFSGWLNDRDLRSLLCSSDVCLVPDPKTALSDASTLMKIAEYMAMSRPIVAYDLAETRVTAGDAAVYVRPNDSAAFARAISELLDDPDRRAQMGAIGHARVRDGLSWEHSERALLAAYAEALSRALARRPES
jgi:glycosyltransferase involved in cell wall biosynthesis